MNKLMNIDVNPNTKAYVMDSVQINTPVNKVYSLIANINEWPKWFEGVTEVHLQGDIQEGSEFIWKAKGYTIKSKIHTIRSNSAIGWTGRIWWIKAVHNWQFISETDDITKVIVQESFSGFGSSLLKNSLKKDIRKDLIGLKKEAEK